MTTQESIKHQVSKFDLQPTSEARVWIWSIQKKAYSEHIKNKEKKRKRKSPTDGGKNNHRLPFLFPGASLTPACLCAATNLNPKQQPDRARHLCALRGGVSDTYQLYMPNTLFFCHLEKVARNEVWRKTQERVDRKGGWTEPGVLLLTPSLQVWSTRRSSATQNNN